MQSPLPKHTLERIERRIEHRQRLCQQLDAELATVGLNENQKRYRRLRKATLEREIAQLEAAEEQLATVARNPQQIPLTAPREVSIKDAHLSPIVQCPSCGARHEYCTNCGTRYQAISKPNLEHFAE
jgi:hypothetical protein